MSNLYIFRHGETFVSKNKLPNYGKDELTAKILPEGVPPIERIGKYLKEINTDINLTSPYNRCLESANIVTKFSGKEFQTDSRLGEYRADLENMEQFIARIKNFVEEITSRGFENILICSHGYPISAILQYATRQSISIKKLLEYPNPGVLMILKNGELTKIDFNKKDS